MADRVLILGGQGRIGNSVMQDLIAHTPAQVTITGRHRISQTVLAPRVQFLSLDLADREGLRRAIASHDLVIHCAGPFLYRDASVLKNCIKMGVNYLDVSDNRAFIQKAFADREAATAAGVTAIINTGVFPGISNGLVRQAIERLDQPETIHLSYGVAGSGGAGVTVMRTTFLGLLDPFEAWIDNQWRQVKPYSDRETIHFPQPYGKVGVYWFDIPETVTLVKSFPVKTVITKFGSIPDIYNHLTWLTARLFPADWLRKPENIEYLSQLSYRMTQLSDRISGMGIAIRSQVTGYQENQPVTVVSTLVHENTAAAAGAGTGSIAQFILAGQLRKPGVWSVEQALATELFEQAMQHRKINIHSQITPRL